MRALPCGVAWAVASNVSAMPRLVVGAVMLTTCSPGRRSEKLLHGHGGIESLVPGAHAARDDAAHRECGGEAAGATCMRAAVIMPPSEWPQAIVRVGVPTRRSKVLSGRSWSGIACCSAQPVRRTTIRRARSRCSAATGR